MSIINVKNFPLPLYRRLKQRAGADHRSLAQEVIHLLEEALTKGRRTFNASGPLLPARKRHSIMELRGLGKGIWKDTDDIETYLREERDSWERKGG